MNVIQALVFDMDGVMFDTEQLAVRAWMQAGEALGWPIDRSLCLRLLGLNTQSAGEVLTQALGPAFNYHQARQFMNERLNQLIVTEGIPLKPGLKDLQQWLEIRQWPYCVATSSDQARTDFCLASGGLEQAFPQKICGNQIRRSKPAPDIYLAATQLLKIRPEHCLAVEDSPNGAASALAAGLQLAIVPDLIELQAFPAHILTQARVFPDLNKLRQALEQGMDEGEQ
ncbi:HAD family phosphatase [Oscillospiraceae bacterium HV4-5-C5C]|nr:HAD family phosphatase [Oscillospiraceae bacterium HV4-5-C5C]